MLLLAVSFGVSLAGVQLALGPIIETNKVNETLEKVPELVLGKELSEKMTAQNQSLEIAAHRVAVTKAGQAKTYSVYEARYAGELRGWVVKTKGQGYADAIELLVGLSPDLKSLTGLFVLDQKETPGLGNKIVTMDWRGQFIGAPTSRSLVVVKSGAKQPGEIDAVTGATISSNSVTAMINTAIGDLRKPLTEMEKGKDNNG
ncbi:FMN-binding protein [Breoghania sp.]|uniref:FMN-binding protein n=1 Tax=Breoghania sp. TaxID=2065378 RepID=UPI0029CA3255|nr:FMN-binding protein [Breoghania sp.]